MEDIQLEDGNQHAADEENEVIEFERKDLHRRKVFKKNELIYF